MIRETWVWGSTPCASRSSGRLRGTWISRRRISAVADTLPVRDALVSFVAQQPLRAALFLTYSFDGQWFEDAMVPDLCERPIATMLVIRDRNAIASEAPSVRYRKANACASAVFHPKLALLV